MTTAVKRFLKHLLGLGKLKTGQSEVAVPEKYPKGTRIAEIQREIDERKQRIEEIDRQLERLSKVNPTEVSRSIVKAINTQTIREANIKRQQSTLGYGLKGKFRPRPAYEKRTWDLKKKAEEN